MYAPYSALNSVFSLSDFQYFSRLSYAELIIVAHLLFSTTGAGV